jgi:serine/threonine protein kinase
MTDQPQPPTSAPRVIAGRYRLESVLGRGGMATVWRGVDEVLGRPVAVKTVDLTGQDASTSTRFEREARTTAALSHPNIVTVYDTGVEDHTAYLVMELLPGPTLADRLRNEGPLPIEEVRAIGSQVASALAAAHAAGIVHRDIKPGNIAYGAEGAVKVLDFGITQLLDDALHGGHQPLTATNTVIGTAEYLSPEQAHGERVDARADLYALGCVLTALLTGRPPFSAPTPVAVLMKHTQETPADVREARPETPAGLAVLVADLLSKDLAARPQSAGEVVERLRTLRVPARTEVLPPVAAVPAVADEPPSPYAGRAGEEERRRSWAWVPWLLLAALAAALGAYILLNQEDSGTPAAPRNSPAASTPSLSPTMTSPSPVTVTNTVTQTPTSATSASSPSTPSSPSTSSPATLTPEQAVTAFREALKTVTDSGALEKKAANDISKTVKDLEKAIRDQDAGESRTLVGKLETQVSEAASSGALSQEGASTLAGPFSDLSTAVSAMQ